VVWNPVEVIGNFHYLNHSGRAMSLQSTLPLIEISEGKVK